MNSITSSFQESFSILKKDKVVLFLSFVPVFIGVVLYGLMGGWLFKFIFEDGKEWILSKISGGMVGSILYYFVVTLVTVILLILVNYTFVLVVSLVACPFNDIISNRVEKAVAGKEIESLMTSVNGMLVKIGKIIVNESKKISIILCLSILGFVLSFFPLLAPISIMISAILLSVSFVDYSWSRNELTMSECLTDYKSMFFKYSISGAGFLFVLSVPVVNIFFYPLATIYFTVLYSRNKLNKLNME